MYGCKVILEEDASSLFQIFFSLLKNLGRFIKSKCKMSIFEILQIYQSFYNLQKSALVGKEDVQKDMESRTVEDPKEATQFLNVWNICNINLSWILS